LKRCTSAGALHFCSSSLPFRSATPGALGKRDARLRRARSRVARTPQARTCSWLLRVRAFVASARRAACAVRNLLRPRQTPTEVHMNAITKFAAVFAAVSAFSLAALASPADDALSSLMKARQSLITLLDTTDKPAQATLQSEIGKASKEVDDSIKVALADKTTAKDAAAKYKELKEVWEAFKKTRDGEIVPAVKAGKADAAKALAKGIQAERFGKMKELLGALGAK
jgi:hypothetical protein